MATRWFMQLDIALAMLQLALVIALAIALYSIIRLLPVNEGKRRKFALARQLTYRARFRPLAVLSWSFRVPNQRHLHYKRMDQLFSANGWNMNPAIYIFVKRAGMAVVILVLIAASMPISHSLSDSIRIVLVAIATLIVIAGLSDQYILEKLRVQRRYRVMRDIDTVSRQLLYYSDMATNIHGKLVRCLPFTRAIRREWTLLVNEWYQDAGLALKRFQDRLATEEGISFADTLDALRQYDHERYYELLKQRIADYKDKLDMFKESRKESLSYLLFVMSGVPIMFTFRLFIYPWVAEGQKLFESLG